MCKTNREFNLDRKLKLNRITEILKEGIKIKQSWTPRTLSLKYAKHYHGWVIDFLGFGSKSKTIKLTYYVPVAQIDSIVPSSCS